MSVASVILWYHREAEEKKQKLPVHTQYRKGSLDIARGSFLLKNVGIWYIMEISYCVWRKKMSEGVKAAVIGGIFTIVGAGIGASATYFSNVGNDVVSRKEYEAIKSDYEKLLKESISEEKQNDDMSSDDKISDIESKQKSNENSELKEIWLEELTPISCTYKDGGGSGALNYKRWSDERDNGGNVYSHGVYIGDSYNSLFYKEVAVVYNLENKYSKMEGTIVLSEQGKNQSGEARLKIVADEDFENPKFVTKNNVSPGFLPEDFNINVANVRKLTIILERIDGDGYWSRDFGIVNAKLY